MNLRVAGPPLTCSLNNGKGIRYVIFCQGCKHHCPGCQNPETWDFAGGELVDVIAIEADILEHPFIDGVTFSGGDPMEQQEAFIEIARFCHEHHLNVWCYTGYVFEDLTDKPLLQHVDVLVDGPFIESLTEGEHPYCGSTNQRIIHLGFHDLVDEESNGYEWRWC